MSKSLGQIINSTNFPTIEKIFQKHPKLRDKHQYALKDFFECKNKFFPHNPTYVLEKEWDHLIILDACRFDYFKEYNPFSNGSLSKIQSAGSHTSEWFAKNFRDKNLKDMIYVSGTPQISNFMVNKRVGYNPFFKIENVWDYGWNEEYRTTLPETITEASIESIKNHPEKKHIIHYIQPHVPFIKNENLRRDGMTPIEDRSKGEGEKIWVDVKAGKVNLEELKEAYKENLLVVFPEVEKLIKYLEGKIIITSDHGNLFGEYFLFGHPSNFHFKELIEVPWYEIDEIV